MYAYFPLYLVDTLKFDKVKTAAFCFLEISQTHRIMSCVLDRTVYPFFSSGNFSAVALFI